MSDGCDVQVLPLQGTPLVRDYQEAFERAARFYPAGGPSRLETFRQAAERARARTPDEVYRTLDQGLRPAGPASARALERVARERGLVVTTGQQAGLFTGPLYALYKALTAVRLAARLEEALGIPVLPVFWIASEDHDWDEVGHAHVVDLENRLQRIEVAAPIDLSAQSPPIFRLAFGEDVADAVAALDRATPDSEFKDDLLTPLAAAYAPAANVATAFEVALGDLLRETPLCLVQASSPWIKARSRPVLAREWERRREVAERLERWDADLRAAGYEPQVAIAPGATNLFLEGPAGRDRVLLDGDGARLRRSDLRLSEGDLAHRLEQAPDRVSPNVLLRPVVESALLPVVATVGGPSEISYFAQTPPLFEVHEVPPPPIVPRASFRLVEARIERALEKTGVAVEALSAGAEAVARDLARGHRPPEIEAALARLRDAIAADLDRIDPSLEGAVGRARTAAEKALHELEGKITSSVKRRDETLLEQLRKAAAHLAPLAQPQERVLNAYPYLIRYGRALIDQIAARIRLPLDAADS
jgi:bacillithiol biosynthesis cysteine-adding enzyme BshC